MSTRPHIGNSKRNSSIEFLKIIAILMIVLSHSVPFWYNEQDIYGKINIISATSHIQSIILIIFRYLGQVGNVIFIISSAYFLQESKKANVKKVLYMMVDVFIISIVYLVIFLLLGYKLPSRLILQQFLPITSGNNWFIGCYLLYYIIHPLLNKIIESLDKKQLLHINMFIIIYYCCVQFILSSKYNSVTGFILIYFIVAYFKKYLKEYSFSMKINSIILLISLVLFIASILIFNFIGMKISALSDKMLRMTTIINPFVIAIAMSMFNIFNKKTFYNKKINYISSLSLLIYIIHDNVLSSEYGKPVYWRFIRSTFSYSNIVVFVILTAIIVFIISLIIATTYKETIQKLVKKVCNKIYNILEKIANKATDTLLKLN